MKEWLKENLSFSAKLWLKRLLVACVGASVRAAAFAVRLSRRLTDAAVKHGLDFERAWNVPPRAAQDVTPLQPWGASDFLMLLETAEGLEETAHASRPVRASIIIPVFNKVEYTFQCLRSLVREVDLKETEIIVVDNASTDETARLLSHFSGLVRVVTNEENKGFVDACNEGAALARGRFLVFLNNDTIVLPGWLDELVNAAESDERVGAAGSMFLYPSGMLQEAGSIVWRDGAPYHYGWGGSPEDRRYTFARDVDYCSGASLLIRRELFERLGGFDRRYAPAYYEDTDLCFSVRAQGFRVLYQPASRLIHFEGVTAGTDTGVGVKQNQIVNQKKFYEKWRETLERAHYDRATTEPFAASDRRAGPSVFVFDERIPTPDRDAGSARMFVILQSLTRWSRPVFIPLNRPAPGSVYERALWREGVETASLTDYARLLRERRPYAAVFSRPAVADALLDRVRRLSPTTKLVFDTVDLHFIRLGREHAVSGDDRLRAEAGRYRELETRLAQTSDLVWCCSPEDRRVLEALAPGIPIEVVPTIHAANVRGRSFAERHGLLFIGNLHHRPNADGVRHFIDEVFPAVVEALPDVRLDIVGDHSSSEIAALQSERVRVTGYVPLVEPFYESARVFIAPIRFGAGIRGKIGEALAHGLPVVTTTIGAEGLGLEHELNVLIADDPAAFADAVVRLHRDPELWQRLSDNGYAHVQRHFSPAVVERTINETLARLGGQKNVSEEAGRVMSDK